MSKSQDLSGEVSELKFKLQLKSESLAAMTLQLEAQQTALIESEAVEQVRGRGRPLLGDL